MQARKKTLTTVVKTVTAVSCADVEKELLTLFMPRQVQRLIIGMVLCYKQLDWSRCADKKGTPTRAESEISVAE